MYKSEQHRLDTERFVNSMKSLNYAESTLARKILAAPGRIQESLKGSSGAEKARILRREFYALPTATTSEQPKEDIIWDKRVVVPLGTVVNGSPTIGDEKKDNGSWYIVDSVINDSNLNLVHTVDKSKRKISYGIARLNEDLRNFRWGVVNPTPENTKLIGKKPIPTVIVDQNKPMRDYSPFPITEKPSNIGLGWFHKSPTGNCQLSMIGNAASMLSRLSGDALKKGILTAAAASGKRLILMDIKNQLVSKLTAALPKAAFTINAPYTSTNGSSMCIVLLNTTKF